MAFALHFAVSHKQLSETDSHRALNLLEVAGLPTKMPGGISIPILLEHLFRDKKREGEAIKMILPKDELGVVNYNELIQREEIEKRLMHFST
jgi:3-dehydroquinate synthetase